MGVYTVFGFFIAMGISHVSELSFRKLVLLGVVIAGIYGASDEFHQMFVPTRSAEVLDLVSDCIGGLFGSAIYGYRLRFTKTD